MEKAAQGGLEKLATRATSPAPPKEQPMRRFMLSTFALIALALPAAAQERICREPNRLAVEFATQQMNSQPRWETPRGDPLNFRRNVHAEAGKIFERAFKEHCQKGDLISLFISPQSWERAFYTTHCDFTRPINQFGENVICFAQVPPRQ
jgi:hypothetical protein